MIRRIVVLLISFLFLLASRSASADDALKDLPSGWSHDVVFQSELVSPTSMAEDESGNLFVLERCGDQVVRLPANGPCEVYVSTAGTSVTTLAYQPNAKRLIGFGTTDTETAIYEITPSGLNKIGKLSDDFDPFFITIDPTDDSILATSGQNTNGVVKRYSATGTYQETLLTGLQSVGQIVVSPQDNVLYYSEAVAKTVSALDLNTQISTVLVSDVGTGALDDFIGVAVDDQGLLYYHHFELHSYSAGQVTNWDDSNLGFGPIMWSSSRGQILCANIVSATVDTYDPDEPIDERHGELTTNVNTYSVAERSDGTFFLCPKYQLYKIESSTLVALGDEFGENCVSLALGASEQLYLALDRPPHIQRIADDGTPTVIKHDIAGERLSQMSYDRSSGELVALTVGDATVSIWRLDPNVSDPTPTKVVTFSDPTEGWVPAVMTVDHSGQIYVYRHTTDAIHKVSEPSGQLESFHNDVKKNSVPPGELTDIIAITYSSVANGIIVALNNEFELWKSNPTSNQTFANNACGIDNAGLFEKANGELVGTHSGQVFRLTYSAGGPSDAGVDAATDGGSSSAPGAAAPSDSDDDGCSVMVIGASHSGYGLLAVWVAAMFGIANVRRRRC